MKMAICYFRYVIVLNVSPLPIFCRIRLERVTSREFARGIAFDHSGREAMIIITKAPYPWGLSNALLSPKMQKILGMAGFLLQNRVKEHLPLKEVCML